MDHVLLNDPDLAEIFASTTSLTLPQLLSMSCTKVSFLLLP